MTYIQIKPNTIKEILNAISKPTKYIESETIYKRIGVRIDEENFIFYVPNMYYSPKACLSLKYDV